MVNSAVTVHMHRYTIGILIFALLFSVVPGAASASHEDEEKEKKKESSLEVAGWIPYWAVKKGTASALKHIDQLDAVYPFVFTIKEDGTLRDNGDLKGKDWQKLFKEARRKDVDIIPTIMTSNGGLVHVHLSDPKRRKKHIDGIVKMVEEGKFDGVDIDYENRTKVTVDYFSKFLEELKEELGDKKLVCTLEPRTPPESLWKVVPNPLPYSNDYDEIKDHCDVIQIMTYDQQRADLKLNESKAGQPYFPNSDKDWVEKVVKHTIKELPPKKLMLGVPTYGRHVGLVVAPNWFQNYTPISAVNEHHALAIAKQYKIKPSINRAGEKVVTYIPASMDKKTAAAIRKMKVSKDISSGLKVAMQALAYADKTGKTVTVNMVSWSDATPISDKVDIAKKYNLKGIAVFKIDGEEDTDMWKLF